VLREQPEGQKGRTLVTVSFLVLAVLGQMPRTWKGHYQSMDHRIKITAALGSPGPADHRQPQGQEPRGTGRRNQVSELM
jgi:hypothetical protein